MKHIIIACFLLLAGAGQADELPGKPANTDSKSVIRIALLLDTSNSMDGLIEQAKSQLWEMVNQMIKARYKTEKPDLELALYEYGNSGLAASEGFIRMVTPLTDDLDQISADLFSLTTNGGDEFCGAVIKRSLDQLNWEENDKNLQFIFIAGNEPFNQGNVPWEQSCKEASDRAVIVNTIYCGEFQTGINEGWKSGAMVTGGEYMNINTDAVTVFIPSPYDDKINKLNQDLNGTYLAYGHEGSLYKERQAVQDANAQQYGSANSVSRAVSKSSRLYKNSSWDLIDALEEEEILLEDLEEDELPDELKGKNEAEMKKIVAEMAALRQSINEQIQELNKQRETFVAKERKKLGETNQLDNAMLGAIKKQATDKGFHFEE